MGEQRQLEWLEQAPDRPRTGRSDVGCVDAKCRLVIIVSATAEVVPLGAGLPTISQLAAAAP